MDEIRERINNLINVTEEQTDYILSHFELRKLNKEECFIDIGHRCNEVAFLKSGIVRFYYLAKNDMETTCYFAFPNEFITSVKSFNMHLESKEAIQAATDVELYVIKRNDIEKLYNEVPETQKITRKIYEDLSLNLQKRIALLQINSAEDRYNYLRQKQSELLQNVPLQYLASFLGVTPQHLSRLRKSKINVL